MFTKEQIIEMIYYVNGNISKEKLEKIDLITLKCIFPEFVKWKFENDHVISPDGRISDIHEQFSEEDKKKWVDTLNYRLHNLHEFQIWMPFVSSEIPEK